jgi:hypothetical protein
VGALLIEGVAEESQKPLVYTHGSEAPVFACNELSIPDSEGTEGMRLFSNVHKDESLNVKGQTPLVLAVCTKYNR